MTTAEAPPSDYRLLVPRDWFRVDLTHERWRRQLKTFVDKQSTGSGASAETTRRIWTALRNAAESGVAQGALEFFLKTESPDGAAVPASLLVSMAPSPRGLAPRTGDFARALARRVDASTTVDVVELPAGEAVRTLTETAMDFHVRMPGEVGYLHLAFSIPLSGTDSLMGNLCDAIAHSLRWV
ncbi:hypothetical protein [Streptomyces justiciae]|uniref:hypothetical protein n=1 Tax=Streptomyces justiciae TaxID=2780140 RepID=UPI001882ABD4|nr:hypothetical protein [Streptomyces justiciae]MBE8478168.1 hypothetical protein [Streptomyces justiciae]MCW8375802.1 hypothetical protein [Streptomyces justiciae]